MKNFELNNQGGTAVMEEEIPVNDNKTEDTPTLDNMPYEDFISEVENEILTEERDKTNGNINYLETWLDKIRKSKDVFLPQIKSEERRLCAKIFFEIQEVVLKNLIENKRGVRSEAFLIGDAEWQQEIIFLVNRLKDKPDELEAFWAQYKALFENEDDIEDGNIYKAGILATLALQNILTEKYGLEVNYPKPVEDVWYSIDMVANDRLKKNIFLIQIKTDKEEIEKIIKRDLNAKRNETNTEKKLIKTIPRFEFGDDKIEMHKDYKDFSKGCSKYVEKNRESFRANSGYTTKGVYIYVPYVINGDKHIDIDGTPDEMVWKILVAENLENELDLPNKYNYDNLLKK